MSDGVSGKLKEQDLTNLDVTKLTPSSPEVISRQATINIGTIGHVAHGKSTIVKAVSGVQTVRFKNELERNITIKLDESFGNQQHMTNLGSSSKRKDHESDLNSSKNKVYRSDEKSSDTESALLSKAVKCIDDFDDSLSSLDTNDIASFSSVLDPEKSITEIDDELSDPRVDTDDTIEVHRTNSIAQIYENVVDNIDSTPGDNDLHSEQTILNNSSKYQESSDSDTDYISKLEASVLDTAFISVPPVSDKNVDASYSFVTTDERVKCFIFEGGMLKDDNSEDVYDPSEIDEIINDAIIYGVHYYLVKWTKWSRGFNTWERFQSLRKSQKHIHDYIILNRRYNTNRCKPINGMHLMLSRKKISSLFNLFRTRNGLSLPSIVPEDLSGLFNSLDVGNKNSQLKRRQFFISSLASISLGSFRQQQLSALKQWEDDINLVSGGYKIAVENNIDLEGPPNIFVYVTCYIPQPDIIIPDDPPIGCNCKKDCLHSTECCNDISGYSGVYDVNKKITVAPGFPIFECNKKCKCSSKCINRVVQHGSQVEVCIYKTGNYGWGIKTRQNIQKGQFVANYVGEIVTVEESESRLANNNSSLDLMWNLDFDDENNYKYIIDGSHYANYTYFINHSCNANLNVYAVWINCLDRNLPQLALFACRDICVGEQLTTNYFSRCDPNTLKKTGQKCKCDMKNCQGYYF